jgi:transcriptional regulator with XRE-family HTH domain
MSRRSGVTRSTIYRWMAGEVQPDYGKAYSLAYAVHPRYPGLARDLVEASGYAWAEPTEAPEPPRIPPDVLAAIEKRYPPERQAEIIEMLEQFSGHDEAPGDGEGRSPSAGDGGTRHAG